MIALLKLGLTFAMAFVIVGTVILVREANADALVALYIGSGFVSAVVIGMGFLFTAMHDRLEEISEYLKRADDRAAKAERADWQSREKEQATLRATR